MYDCENEACKKSIRNDHGQQINSVHMKLVWNSINKDSAHKAFPKY